LFQLVPERYTKGCIIVTSTESYSQWDAIFGYEVAAAAIVDRLLHYSTPVNIRRDSYWLKRDSDRAARRLGVGKRETGVGVPSTNQPVKFSFRLS
jgi:hypothetical protein